MRRLTFAFMSAILLSASTQAMDPRQAEAFAKICKEVLCRTPHVKLRIDDTHFYEDQGQVPVPVFAAGLVSVYPGETIYLEAHLEGKRIVLDRAVPAIEKPDTTFTLTFRQLPQE